MSGIGGRGVLAMAAGALLLAAANSAQASAWDEWKDRKHSFFVSLLTGPTAVRPSTGDREVEGAAFNLSGEGSGLAGAVAAGFWFKEGIGVELGYRKYGSATVPLRSQEAGADAAGTGESEISFSGTSASVVAGRDFGPLRLSGRAGVLFWNRDLDNRFDAAGGESVTRTLHDAGTGLVVGLGLGVRLYRGLSLVAQVERSRFEDDEVDVAFLGVEYDFINLIRGD